MERILISGGTGLIGKCLSRILLDNGYEVGILSRSKRNFDNMLSYTWDVEKGEIEEEAITSADHIIHLAGASVAEKPWTKARKEIIYNSRIDSTRLLHDKLASLDHKVKSFVSTSAVGFYGIQHLDQVLTESLPPGTDFLATVCRDWEVEAKKIKDLGIRTTMLRVGLVLSLEGGALEKIVMTQKFGVLSYFGDGQMYNPWIHVEDVSRMYAWAVMDDSVSGIFNAAAPVPVTNKDLVEHIKSASGKFALITPAPAFGLKLALGELSQAILSSYNTSAEKIMKAGFEFNYADLDECLKDLLK